MDQDLAVIKDQLADLGRRLARLENMLRSLENGKHPRARHLADLFGMYAPKEDTRLEDFEESRYRGDPKLSD